MWHEARKQEKKIRGMIVDYRKRADRRKEFYERIRADPVQFLQLHGRKCKINYDVTDVTDESHMMKWQGQGDNLIDRFDVRAHLDYIPPLKASKEETKDPELSSEERFLNYERFRVLAQNEFLGVSEDTFLKQLQLEEQFGVNAHQMDNDKVKKKNSQANAAIGYIYEDSSSTPVIPFSQTIQNIESSTSSNRFDEFAKDYSDESDMDVDVSVDINKIGTQEAHELNNCGKRYGMMTNDFFSYLTKDEDEKQSMKALKEQEADKVVGGRKSRRERRSQREKRILGKPLSPPSYAAKEEKKASLEEEEDEKSSRENSKSPSPEKITYITSFGGEDELKPHPKISIKLKPTVKLPGPSKSFHASYADQVRQNLEKLKKLNKDERNRRKSRSTSNDRRRRSRSRSRRRRESSRSTSNSRRHRYSSRSTSGSRRRRYSSRSYSSDSRRRTRSSRSYSQSSYSSNSSRTPERKLPYSRKRSYSSRSLSPKHSRSTSKKRSYSSTSSSTRRSTSFSSRYSTSSPEKRPRHKKSPRRENRSQKKSLTRDRSPKRKSTTRERISPGSKLKSSTRDRSLRRETLSKEKSLRRKSTTREKSFTSSPEKRRKSKSLSTEQQSSSSRTAIALSSEVAPFKRYYGRRKDNESSSSLSVDSDSDDTKKTGSNQSSANDVAKVKPSNRSAEFKVGMSRSTVGGPTVSNPREKLKKKMQLLLNKQYKADKKAETERIERQLQQQQERDEEMRELALKLRRKQRELRHKYGDTRDSKSGSDSDENDGGGASGSTARQKRRSRSTSSSSSSSSSSNSRYQRQKRAKRPASSIARSPVKYSRRSRSRSSGRNPRQSRSRSRDRRR